MPILFKALLVTICIFPIASTAGAADIDLHKLWDSRCAECHGHAGDFARQFLKNMNGELQGRHHVDDLRRFMHSHYLPENAVTAVYDMLLAQASIPARFKNECSSCHSTAAEFARKSLHLRGGDVYGVKSGVPVRVFLGQHQRLNQEDIEYYVRLLMRIRNEVKE